MSDAVNYNIVAEDNESTVVSKYIPTGSTSDNYQSEAALENELIQLLTREGYEYLPIHTEKDLLINLRHQLEIINDITFSDDEWKRFFKEIIANPNNGIVEKTRMIQQDHIQVLKRDDGSSKNISLIDKVHVYNNRLQVINQYVNNDGKHDNRYDVTLLVNGFPMVHIELKRRGVAIREAFNQINRYQNESFWAGSGLYEYVQIFVISNGTHTKYYSNTTRDSHIKETTTPRGSSHKTSNSFEFTSYWADTDNKPIPDLIDFAKTFLAKHTILNILTKYCVFTTENLLLVMRPYQITATERILNRIEIANNYHWDGSIKGGGYIWHTTGSGKTLTSFKTAQLASRLPFIDTVLFVVDRKDLDYQTMKEYDRFEKGAADGNNSTAVLERQLSGKDKHGNPHDYRIIITTIQKLSTFVSRAKNHPIANKKVVLIFDECHRSQFGEMHKKITSFFKHYFLFGFTGTPIFSENASHYVNPKYATTPQLFGERLHTYTIVNAINDGNVLPFRIDYYTTFDEGVFKDQKVQAIDTEKAYMSPERIKNVVSTVLEHYDQKTKASAGYVLKGRHVHGFNSIFACQSIPMDILYYNEFKKQIKESGRNLKVATIYSYAPNDDSQSEGMLSEENEGSTDELDASSREALDNAINDYNLMFHTNFDTSSARFQNYYKDLSQRFKNREIDILIVVNMFLTGFDATTLNTLWVDKNLKMHGLLQAFSRTNRILNSVKTYGNIVCFRNLKERVDEAISLFGDKDAESIVLLKDYGSYYYGYNDEKGKHHWGYKELVDKLLSQFPVDQQIVGEKAEKDFISTFGSLLRVMNILTAFDQFKDDQLLSERDMQDYQSVYADLYEKYRPKKRDAANINDDLVFEVELVRQIEVNIDYILELVQKYHDENTLDAVAVARIMRAVGSSMELRSKKELIEAFLRNANLSKNVTEDWHTFVNASMEADVQKLIDENHLKPAETRKFIRDCFRYGSVKTEGTVIDQIMPPMSRFSGGREEKKNAIIEKIKAFFDKYSGITEVVEEDY